MPLLTIVIPTFNRAEKLSRLIQFLQRAASDLAIIVLDSSGPAVRDLNIEMCRARNVKHVAFASDIVFYDKLATGLREHVDTPAACLCADDDVVFPGALMEAAHALIGDDQAAVAHGAYAQFTTHGGMRLTNIIYTGDGIGAARPVERVAKCLMHYEATIYGVHRSDTLLMILDEARAAPSLFAAEILTAVLAHGVGSSLRLQNFTHARSVSPSHKSFLWHPAELLASNPEHLVVAFQFVLQRLKHHVENMSSQDERLFHLATISYLSDYADPVSTRRVVEKAMAGASEEELSELGFNEYAALQQGNSFSATVRRSAPVRELKRLLARHDGLNEYIIRRWRSGFAGTTSVTLETFNDETVTVKMEPGFLQKLARLDRRPNDPQVRELIKGLASYSKESNNDICQ